jgi:hypothetical protein
MRPQLKELLKLNKELSIYKKYRKTFFERKASRIHIKIQTLEDKIFNIEADITFQSGIFIDSTEIKVTRLQSYLRRREAQIDKAIGKNTPLFRYDQNLELIQDEEDTEVIIIEEDTEIITIEEDTEVIIID